MLKTKTGKRISRSANEAKHSIVRICKINMMLKT